MARIHRRSFLTASMASLLAGLAGVGKGWAQGKRAGAAAPDFDVVIVGAGAAGIAAARRLAGTGARIAWIEAADRSGGRCLTDTARFGMPFDLGAWRIFAADTDPLAKLAAALPGIGGSAIAPAPPGQRLRIGRRNARDVELEGFLAALVRAQRAIADAARLGKADVALAQVLAQALPKDLGELRAGVAFVLGPYLSGRDVGEVSVQDFARFADRGGIAYCRPGYGTLLAGLAGTVPGVAPRFGTPARQVNWSAGSGVEVTTPRGTLRARAAIVTVSTGVLAGESLRFLPDLPKRQQDAVGQLPLGHSERVGLELRGNPLGLLADDLVFEKAHDGRTAALLGNIGGSAVSVVNIGGGLARDLAAQGDAAMTAFAVEWLAGLYGNDVRRGVGRSLASAWSRDPLAGGAWAMAAVGGQGARRVLMEPLRERLWFAGEAVHETAYGTVAGAWQSGERAASEAARHLGLLRNGERPAPTRPAQKPAAKRRPQRPVRPVR